MRWFSIVLSMVALASFGDEYPTKLRTDYWGIAFTNVFAASKGYTVNETNTPGNVNCRMRLTHPSYYAFMDGFDTRASIADGAFMSDDVQTNAVIPSYRFLMMSWDEKSLQERYEDLANLCIGAASNSCWWSSSAYEPAMTNDCPPVRTLDWCHNIVSNIYKGYQTCWLPCFGASRHNDSVYSFRGVSEVYKHGLVFQYVLPALTLGDRYVYEYLNGDGTVDERTRQSLPAFDDVIRFAYDIPSETNLLNIAVPSRRHIYRQIAEADQALSLVDKAVHVNADLTAYTNKVMGTGKIKYGRDATLGPLWIDFDSEWGATIDWAHSWPVLALGGNLTTESTNSVTNVYYVSTSPRLRATPTYLFAGGGGFDIDGLSGNVFFATGAGYEVSSAVLPLLDGTNEYYEAEVTSFVTSERTCCMTIRVEDRATATLESDYIPLPTNGNYSADGHVSVEAYYHYEKTTAPRLPYYNSSPVWPTSTRFKPNYGNPYRTVVFGSFADVGVEHSWSDRINFESGDLRDPSYQVDDWTERNDWGYRTLVDDYYHCALWKGVVQQMLVLLEAKSNIGGVDYPATYTGLSADALNVLVNNFNTNYLNKVGAVFSVSVIGSALNPSATTQYIWSGDCFIRDNDGDIEFYVRNSDGSVGQIVNPDGRITACTWAVLFDLSLSTTGIEVNHTKPRSVDTHIKSATEATFDFPQLTTRGYDVHNM